MSKVFKRAAIALSLLSGFSSALAQGMNTQIQISSPENVKPVDPSSFVYPEDGIFGQDTGSPTVIVFIDRGSPHCRAQMSVLAAVAASDPEARVVIKELPLLSPLSVYASAAATVVRGHGLTQWKQFEAALMASDTLEKKAVHDAALDSGINESELANALRDPEIQGYLQRNRDLAQSLNIHTVPTIIVGSNVMVGFQSANVLRAKIHEARASK